MSYSIDTKILIEIENDNRKVIEHISKLKLTPMSDFYITIFTFSEFYTGIINKSKKSKEIASNSLNKYKLLNTSRNSGLIFCELYNEIKKNRNHIPTFDLMIASICIANNQILITSYNHFKNIPNLKMGYIGLN